MPRILSDSEIAGLLNERKVLPRNWERRLAPRTTPGQAHLRRSFALKGEEGHQFVIDVRQNPNSLLDFSVILSFLDTDGHRYILIRFNGKHQSQHTNKWEKKNKQPNAEFRNAFHVHTATERYQEEGFSIDGYAKITDSYSSFETALRAFADSNGFVPEGGDAAQGRLFEQ